MRNLASELTVIETPDAQRPNVAQERTMIMITITITTGWHATVKLAASIVILASFAIGFSACSTANSSLPMISAAQVASGQPLPLGILPNGIIYDPYGQ
jgi:hypothetical protein